MVRDDWARKNRGGAQGLLATGTLLALSALLTVLASGCSQGTGGAEPGIATLADGTVEVRYARLPERLLALDTLAVWDLWGDDQGYLFNDIMGAAGTADGFLLVDRGNREVVRVDLAGRVLAHFGRRGQGPGEFQFPHAIEVAGDRIWVSDLMNGRFSIFDSDGIYQRDLRWADLGWRGSNYLPLPDGRLLLGAETSVGFDDFDRIVPTEYVLLRDPAAQRADTLAAMPGMRQHQIIVRAESGQQMAFVGPPQFAPRLHWAATAGGRLFTVSGEEYRIEERDLSGRVVRTILAPAPDLTVTQRDRDWFFTEEFRFGFGSGEMFKATQASLEDYPFAERRQAITGLAVDPLRRLWVRAGTEHPGRPRMDLFTLEGTYLGSLGTLPLPLAFAGDGFALLMETDREGTETYRVVRPLLP
jgi:hypothetical protein